MAILIALRDIDMALGHVQPFEFGQRRLLLRRPHIGHDDAVALDAGIGRLLHLVLELALRRLVRLIEAIAVDIVFPAVIEAAQPAFLVLARNRATRRDARNARAAARPCPRCCGRRRDPRRAAARAAARRRLRLRATSSAGSQKRRMQSPIGVPRPVCVRSSFSSRVVICLLILPVAAARPATGRASPGIRYSNRRRARALPASPRARHSALP